MEEFVACFAEVVDPRQDNARHNLHELLLIALCTILTGGKEVNSSGRRNTAYVSCSEELVQSLGRCSPAQGLSRPAVEGDRHGGKVLGAVHAEVGALGKVLAQQPVGVLVRATLPGAVGIAEVDRHASLDPELG